MSTTGFEHAVELVTILLGLALADVAISLHKLLRGGRNVKWDARVILAVIYVLILVVSMWFSLWALHDPAVLRGFPFYLTFFAEFIILFLICAACLPDECGDECDLGAFYERNHRYFWTLVTLFYLSFLSHGLVFNRNPDRSVYLFGAARAGLPIIGTAILIFFRGRMLHLVILALLIAYRLYLYWSRTLS